MTIVTALIYTGSAHQKLNDFSVNDLVVSTEDVLGSFFEFKYDLAVNPMSGQKFSGQLINSDESYDAVIQIQKDRFHVVLDKESPMFGRYEINFKPIRIDQAQMRSLIRLSTYKIGVIVSDPFLATLKTPAGILALTEANSPADEFLLQRINHSEGVFFAEGHEFPKNAAGIPDPHKLTRKWTDSNDVNDEEFLKWFDLESLAKLHAVFELLELDMSAVSDTIFWNNARGKFEWVLDMENGPSEKPSTEADKFTEKIARTFPFYEAMVLKYAEFIAEKSDILKIYRQQTEEIFGAQAAKETDFLLGRIKERYRYLKSGLSQAVSIAGEHGIQIKAIVCRGDNISYTDSLKLGIPNTCFTDIHQDEIKVRHFEGKEHMIEGTLYIEADELMRVDPGAVFLMGPDASILCDGRAEMNGTEKQKIEFRPFKPGMAWGSIVIRGRRQGVRPSRIEHTVIRGGSMTHDGPRSYTGALSVFNADIEMSHSEIADTQGDDGVNVRYSESRISGCAFRGNRGDALDYDFSTGFIKNNIFEDNNDDAVDISFTSAEISENKIYRSGDKGISVGEKSIPIISRNTIKGCNIGVAVKDFSDTELKECIFEENNTAVSIYQKKKSFGKSKVKVTDSEFNGNKRDYGYECENCKE